MCVFWRMRTDAFSFGPRLSITFSCGEGAFDLVACLLSRPFWTTIKSTLTVSSLHSTTGQNRYKTLSDPHTRAVYDKWIHSGIEITWETFRARCEHSPHMHFAASASDKIRAIVSVATDSAAAAHADSPAVSTPRWNSTPSHDALARFRQGRDARAC